jgi:hypothetical protein
MERKTDHPSDLTPASPELTSHFLFLKLTSLFLKQYCLELNWPMRLILGARLASRLIAWVLVRQETRGSLFEQQNWIPQANLSWIAWIFARRIRSAWFPETKTSGTSFKASFHLSRPISSSQYPTRRHSFFSWSHKRTRSRSEILVCINRSGHLQGYGHLIGIGEPTYQLPFAFNYLHFLPFCSVAVFPS